MMDDRLLILEKFENQLDLKIEEFIVSNAKSSMQIVWDYAVRIKVPED